MLSVLKSRHPLVIAGSVMIALAVIGGLSVVMTEQMSNLPGGASVLDGVGDWLPYVLGVFLVVIGTWMIGHRIITDERSKVTTGDQSRMVILIIAAVALSGVSFLTTLFGLFSFAASTSEGPGQQFAFWVISVGTTFGIQVILFVISLELGERLVKMRPRHDDKFHKVKDETTTNDPDDERSQLRLRLVQLVVGLPMVIGLLVLSGSAFGLFNLVDLWNALKGLFDPNQDSNVLLGVAFALAAIVALRMLGFVSNLWRVMVPGFLVFVYLGTLAVSAFFSFDSYYSLFQSEEDISSRRGNIVRDDTTQMLAMAEASLLDADRRLRNGPVGTQLDTDVSAAIDQLVSGATRLDDVFQRAARENAERDRARIIEIDKQIADLRKRQQQEIDRVIEQASDRTEIESGIASVSTTIGSRMENLDDARQNLDDLREEMNRSRQLADCEEQGLSDGVCEGASGNRGCGTLCRRYRRDADQIEEVRIPDTERRIEQLELELTELDAQLRAENLQLTSASSGLGSDEDQIAAIRARYQPQIEDLESTRPVTVPGAQTAESTGFDTSTLPTAFANFKSNPNTTNLDRYVGACQSIRDILLAQPETTDSVRTLDCVDPSMLSFQQQSDRIVAARNDYQRQCTGGASPAGQPAPTAITAADAATEGPQGTTTPSNDLITLRNLAERTRTCLAIASSIDVMLNAGQQSGSNTTLQSAEADLIELIGVYLAETSDMRRSIADLRRGTDFATWSAAGAVFIDTLILVMGFLVAVARPSELYENPLKGDVERLENDLVKVAARYAPDRNAATGLRIFVNYLEARFLKPLEPGEPMDIGHFYRDTINSNAVLPKHRNLVEAILRSLSSRYQRPVEFRPISSGGTGPSETRTAVYEQIVKTMITIANQSPMNEHTDDDVSTDITPYMEIDYRDTQIPEAPRGNIYRIAEQQNSVSQHELQQDDATAQRQRTRDTSSPSSSYES